LRSRLLNQGARHEPQVCFLLVRKVRGRDYPPDAGNDDAIIANPCAKSSSRHISRPRNSQAFPEGGSGFNLANCARIGASVTCSVMSDPLFDRAQHAIEESTTIREQRHLLRAQCDHELSALHRAVFGSAMTRSKIRAERQMDGKALLDQPRFGDRPSPVE
jgi:hypothetical protein